MTTRTRAPARPPLGPTPGQERLVRGEQRAAQREEERGIGLRTTAIVTIAAGEVATIRHGLEAIPELVVVTSLNEPCAYAVLSRTRTEVTVRNTEADPRTVQIGIFG